MRAFISGQAGVAVMLDGDLAVSIDVENSCPVARDQDEWPYLLEGADDAYELTDVSEGLVAAELDLAWRKDRSLHLTLIFLDGETEHDTRKDAADLLENHVADQRALRHVVNRLHVAPIPATADLSGAMRIARKGHPCVAALLGEISSLQAAIALSRQAWELLPPDLFGSALAKESFGFKAVGLGLFTAMSTDKEIDFAGYSRDDIEVVKRWRREIRSLQGSLEPRQPKVANEHAKGVKPHTGRKKVLSYRLVAVVAAACLALVAVVLVAVLNTRTVEASNLVRLGSSIAGVQVMQAPLTGLQGELYGRTLVPYPLRNQSKKTAERLFVTGEIEAREGRLEQAATAFRQSNGSFPTIAARLNEAVALLNTSKLAQAEQLLNSTLPDAERSGTTLLSAAILTNLGHIYRTQGRFDEADQAYSSAFVIDRNSNFRAGEAADLNNLALVLFSRGKLVKALEGFKYALSVAEETGTDSVAADCHLNIARTLSEFGRASEAEQNFQSAAVFYRTLESNLDRANYNLAYGQYMFQVADAAAFYGGVLPPKETDQALRYFKAALNLYESVSNKSGQARSLGLIGAELLAKKSPEALSRYQEALRLTQEIGDLPGEEVALRDFGAWYSLVKSYNLAIQNVERALDIARRIGDHWGECVALEELSVIATSASNFELALKYSNEAVDASLRSGDTFAQAGAYDDLGFILYRHFGKSAEALMALERAYALYSEVNSPFADGTRRLMDFVRNHARPEELNKDRPAAAPLPQ